jgi:predicted metal-binding membrane protein
MMAAMTLPGARPAVPRHTHADGGRGLAVLPLFFGAYLAVWVLVSVGGYAVYRPHGSFAAGVVVIAAGAYELTPLKRHFRRRCSEDVRSGLAFGRSCVGSCIGLMLLALGVMSLTWMSLIAVLVLAQKLLPARAALDAPAGLAIIGFGLLILAAPSSVPGLMPLM